MTLYQTDIYSIVLGKMEAYSFLKQSDNEIYDNFKEYLHSVVGLPFVRAKFKTLSLDDEVMEIEFVLTSPVDDISDKFFVTNVFAQGIVMQWLEQKKNSELTLNYAIYGKEEKAFSQSSHLREVASLYEDAFIGLKKLIRDYGYFNNSYIRGDS